MDDKGTEKVQTGRENGDARPDPAWIGVLPLRTGTRLRQYVLQEAIGAGGFGITYRAEHAMLSQKSYAIKEYFPREFAFREGTGVRPTSVSTEKLFAFGLDRFMQEAEVLALCSHPAIVDVVDYFSENGTAYSVLAYVPGASMDKWLISLGRPPTQGEIDKLLMPLLDALEVVHSHKLLHRDIAPDNILVKPDGHPCLIDFGAARADVGAATQHTAAIVKRGFSPPEQYMGRADMQGPWTDIYALGATLYRAVSGSEPPEAMARGSLGTPMRLAAEMKGSTFRVPFLAAIDRALELKPEARPQSIAAWRTMLTSTGAEATERVPTARTAAAVSPRASSLATEVDAAPRPAGSAFEWGTSAPIKSAGGAGSRYLVLGALGAVAVAGGGLWWATSGPSPAPVPPVSAPNAIATPARPGPAAPAPTAKLEQPSKAAPPQAPAAATVPPSTPAAPQARPQAVPPPATSAPTPAPAQPQPPTPQAAPPSQPLIVPPSSGQAASADLGNAWSECQGKDADRRIAACTRILASPQLAAADQARANLNLGIARREQNDIEGAMAAFLEAVRLGPGIAEHHNQLGIARFLKGDTDRAIADYSEAIRLDPRHGEALNNRAWAYFRSRRARQGLPDADRAVALLADTAYVWDTRANIHEALGNRDQAISDFRRALQLGSTDTTIRDALLRLGVTP